MDGRKLQASLENRFALLKLGTTDTGCDCESSHLQDESDAPSKASPVDNVPQLIDDPLGDAFETRRELQVSWSLFTSNRE